MFRISRRKMRFLTGLVTAMAIGLAFGLISHVNLFQGLQLQSSDFLYRAATASHPGAAPDNKIIIAAIDDKSVEQLGRFSTWPRAYHARAIQALSEAGARVIVFDVLFSEAAPDDIVLIAAIKEAGNVILPMVGTLEAQPPAITGETVTPGSVIKPLKPFAESALAVGHANVTPDEDGIVRRLPLIIPDGEQPEPALALSAIASYLRRPQITESNIKDSYLFFAGREIPLGHANTMLINYEDATAASGFKTISYADVLSKNVTPETVRDRIVLIGLTATGFGDTFWTPMGRMMSGVELHAQAMNTILTANFLKPAPDYITILSILLLSFLCGLAVLRLRVLWATLCAIFLGVIYFLNAFFFFDQGTVLDMLYPPLTVAGVFVGVNLYNITSERREKSEITRTFGRYVSPSVAQMILKAIGEGSLKLGGEERTVTIMFADVRNFTGISENLDPQKLVSILNRYLSVIIRAVLQHQGMVNKFGGDSIMAVWNAPMDCREHAMLATRAAIRAQQALEELREKARNLPRMEFGIGINTGITVAGNMGSADRLEYSVIGDAVNTAARLSGVTPGGRVWIGASTFELIKDYVPANPLEPIFLKGKHEAMQAYEVLDTQDLLAQEHEEPVLTGDKV